jgi:hypothetical protein
MDSSAKTMSRSRARPTGRLTPSESPRGLGGGAALTSAAPLARGRRTLRQASLAKGGCGIIPAALPLFDVSAIIDIAAAAAQTWHLSESDPSHGVKWCERKVSYRHLTQPRPTLSPPLPPGLRRRPPVSG